MTEFNCIWQGLLSGILLSLTLGTVFFSLIRYGISMGYKTGLFIATGVVLSDAFLIAFALLSQNFGNFLKEYKTVISIGGGLILMLMGIAMFIRSKPKSTEGKTFEVEVKINAWFFIGNGILLNVLNPVNFFMWLAISSVLTVEYDYTLNQQTIYFAGCLISIFSIETGISYFAGHLKKWMTVTVMQRINQISGCVFFGIGLKLILGY